MHSRHVGVLVTLLSAVASSPASAQSPAPEPAATPAPVEPAKAEPAKAEPAKAEPAKAEPAKEPAAKAAPAKELSPEELLVSIQEILNAPIALPTKEKETARESPSSVTVFTEKDIRALGVQTLDELLNLAVGLDVRRYREPSNIIAVRGISSEFNERILIMVDGVRVNDIHTGGTTRTVRTISLDNVDRVEVVRGPGSALYGTSAFAGAINVVTKGGEGDEGVGLRAAYGRFNERLASVTLNKDFGKLKVGAYFDYTESSGDTFHINQDTVGHSVTVGDPYRDLSAGLKLSYTEALKFTANFGESESSNFITVSDQASTTSHNAGLWGTASLEYTHDFTDNLALNARITGGYNRWGRNRFENPARPIAPEGLYTHPLIAMFHVGADAYLHYVLPKHSFIVGVTFETEQAPIATDYATNGVNGSTISSSRILDPAHLGRNIFAAYAQYRWTIIEGLKLTAGLRFDYYSDFGATLNPRVGLVYAPADKFYGKIIFGTAFRAPSFREAYSINNPVANGNPAVKPENLISAELVVGFRPMPAFNLEAGAFQNQVLGAIVAAPTEDMKVIYQNVGALRTSGIEAEVSSMVTRFLTVKANYTFVTGENQNGDLIYRTPGIASHIANLIVVGDFFNHLQVTPYLQVRGDRPRDSSLADPRAPTAPYVLLNANVRVYGLLLPRLEFFLHATNLLNKQYVTPSNYPAKAPGVVPDDIPNRGLEIMGGAKYSFL